MACILIRRARRTILTAIEFESASTAGGFMKAFMNGRVVRLNRRSVRLVAALLVASTAALVALDCASSPVGAQTPQSPATVVQVDAASARTSYANFTRVTGTPEEMIFDFGLNDQP